MNNIELAIKPALMFLLKQEYCKKFDIHYLHKIDEKHFYNWLLNNHLISESEFQRLEKENNGNPI